MLLDELFFFEFSFIFTARQSIHPEVGRATVTHPTRTPVPFFLFFNANNTEMCVNWSTREIWKFNCVWISEQFPPCFWTVDGPFDVSACCSKLVWGFVSGPFFFLFSEQHASQLLYVVRGRLLQLVKGKNNPELWILHLSTPNQSQSLFLFWLLVYA
jgi:hypothetical protein